MKGINKLLPVIAILMVGLMIYSISSKTPHTTDLPESNNTSPQLAGLPQGFKRSNQKGEEVTPRFDPRFAKIDPITAFKTPKAVTFSAPMGSETGAFTYNAQQFWELNQQRRGHHTGDDLNGIGGRNSDLGDPVYAIADGIVVFAGNYSPGWGNVLIIAHRIERDGSEVILQSFYAHLEKIEVSVDRVISRGDIVGRAGNAEGQYLAHLHFELRQGLNLHLGPGYAYQQGTQLDPELFLEAHVRKEEAFTKPLSEESKPTWENLKMKNPDRLLEGGNQIYY